MYYLLYELKQMNKIKKIWLCLCSLAIIFGININCFAAIWNWRTWGVTTEIRIDPNVPTTVEDPTFEKWIDGLMQSIKGVINIPSPDDYDTKLEYTMNLIQIAINRLLWILATVALIYMLYCWSLIFFAWVSDSNAKKWKAWIKTAVIALAWIGISWLIVSFIFRFIETVITIS